MSSCIFQFTSIVLLALFLFEVPNINEAIGSVTMYVQSDVSM